MILNRNHFFFLHQRILDKFKLSNEGKLPKSVQKIYGFGSNYTKSKPSVLLAMNNDSKVKSYLDIINKGKKKTETKYKIINGKKLYEINLEAKKQGVSSIEIDEFYEEVYLRYAGYESEQELITDYKSKNPITLYKGYYYSFKKHLIKEFTLEIDYKEEPYLATEYGLHDNPELPHYQGFAKIQATHLYIDLDGNQNDQLKFIAHIGTVHPKKRAVTPCVFMGISVHAGNIIHGEAVLIQQKVESNKRLLPHNISTIKQFLMLKRNISRLKYYGYSSLNELGYRGIPVNTISHMIGTYRVWSLDPGENIIQSKFTIDENYSSRLKSSIYNMNEANQVCLLNISTSINRRLTISAHPDIGIGVISYCIMEIPPKRFKYIEGVYCNVGLENKFPRAGYVIFMKDEPKSFEEEIILKNKIKSYIKKNNSAKKRKDLLEMWQRLLNMG